MRAISSEWLYPATTILRDLNRIHPFWEAGSSDPPKNMRIDREYDPKSYNMSTKVPPVSTFDEDDHRDFSLNPCKYPLDAPSPKPKTTNGSAMCPGAHHGPHGTPLEKRAGWRCE
jgi:hypothetical protein